MKKYSYIFLIGLFHVSVLFGSPSAKALFQRLTGVPLLSYDPRLGEMQELLSNGKDLEAAHIATTDPHFYSTTLRLFAAPLSNEKGDPSIALSDFEALVIGVVRDGLDARLLLTGDFRYEGDASLGLPPPSPSNNDHYQSLEAKQIDLQKYLVRKSPQWSNGIEGVGLFSTRRWASEHYIAGTNRRPTKYALSEFLCVPNEEWKTAGLPDIRVRKDVPRDPGGDKKTYENECRSCHAPLDALSGAFANYDFGSGTIFFGKNWIAPKMTQNAKVYEAGFQTSDNTWFNLLREEHHQERFGWRGSHFGSGLKSFAQMLANSRAFSRCMVKRAYQKVCRESWPRDHTESLETLANAFEKGYQLRSVFENVALLPICLSSDWRETAFVAKSRCVGCDFVKISKSPQRGAEATSPGFSQFFLASLDASRFRDESGFPPVII